MSIPDKYYYSCTNDCTSLSYKDTFNSSDYRLIRFYLNLCKIYPDMLYIMDNIFNETQGYTNYHFIKKQIII